MEKYTNIGHSFYAFFSSAYFWKTGFYQNLKGPNCLSSSLGRLENESIFYSFPALVFVFYIGYMWHFTETRSVYISFYIVITLEKRKKRLKIVITSRNLGQDPALCWFLV